MRVLYVDAGVETFVADLMPQIRAKVLRTINLLERFGHQLGMPHSKHIERHLLELRICGQQDVRIFYTIRNTDVVLLHGFVKKSAKIPSRELATARRKRAAFDDI